MRFVFLFDVYVDFNGTLGHECCRKSHGNELVKTCMNPGLCMFYQFEMGSVKIPGMLIIDTPGHESFRYTLSFFECVCVCVYAM